MLKKLLPPLQQPHITGVEVLVDAAGFDFGFDETVGFVGVGAVGVFAVAAELADQREVVSDVFGLQVPKAKLPDSRGVDHRSGGADIEHPGVGGGVAAFRGLFVVLPHLEVQVREQPVEQAGLADPRMPGDHRDITAQKVGQPVVVGTAAFAAEKDFQVDVQEGT